MRVLVVGASGAIGTRLIPQLTDRGHEVTGSSRSAGKAGLLRALGAEPIVLDVLDAKAAREAVTAARPDAIIYQATALANAGFSRNLDRRPPGAPITQLAPSQADTAMPKVPTMPAARRAASYHTSATLCRRWRPQAHGCGKVVMSRREACCGTGQDAQNRHNAPTPNGLETS
jgi:NADPH:quinone reductase-like Zn-dependent oxidoreductase